MCVDKLIDRNNSVGHKKSAVVRIIFLGDSEHNTLAVVAVFNETAVLLLFILCFQLHSTTLRLGSLVN